MLRTVRGLALAAGRRRAPPAAAQARLLSTASVDKDWEEVLKFSEKSQQPVSMENLVDFGTGRDEQTLILAARWLHTELPVRLAHRCEAAVPLAGLGARSRRAAASTTWSTSRTGFPRCLPSAW